MKKKENTMKTIWNNRQGSRDRSALAVIVTADGNVHKFTGESIPGVCRADVVDQQKNGKWSNKTYEVVHHETSVLVGWHQDWESGLNFPQVSWQTGWAWLAAKAPAASKAGFEAHIRAHCPKTAARWDEQSAAETEFAAPLPEDRQAAYEAALAETARLLAEAEESRKSASAIEAENEKLADAAWDAARDAAREAAREAADADLEQHQL